MESLKCVQLLYYFTWLCWFCITGWYRAGGNRLILSISQVGIGQYWVYNMSDWLIWGPSCIPPILHAPSHRLWHNVRREHYHALPPGLLSLTLCHKFWLQWAFTFFYRHFLWKKCRGKCGSEEHFFVRHFIKILKVPGKVRMQKNTFLAGTLPNWS